MVDPNYPLRPKWDELDMSPKSAIMHLPYPNSIKRPVSRKPGKLFGPAKPFSVNRYPKTKRCIRLKLLVRREPLFM